ncbi:MAG: hypothetical protein EPN60_04375 [Nevskiaceae bacterium]|nr:MAG: hypothetical protein EPO48_12145 [Nevskiaceae bacterium]TAM31415.1 MAG: hypothetical protein EPN60_04375 [Nevskiaceae bacterium]
MTDLVFVCPSGSESVTNVTLSTRQYPTCAQNQGHWIEIDARISQSSQQSSFWAQEVNQQSFNDLLAATAFALATAFAVRMIVNSIRGRK